MNRILHARNTLFLCTLLLIAQGFAHAHGGEDHNDEGKDPTPATTMVARAYAQSDDFELVAQLEEDPAKRPYLLITLDRFKTNAPVSGAKLEVDVAGHALPAQEAGPGVYAVQLDALQNLTPGARLPLTLSVESGDDADLLATTLTLPGTTPGAPAHGHSGYATWAAGTSLILVAVLLLNLRRRFTRKGAP